MTFLEQKKNALERVLKIAKAIESLQTSLETVVLLSKPIRSLPQHAVKLYESLGEMTQFQPTQKIQQTVEKLDGIIRKDLATIMDIVNSDPIRQIDDETSTTAVTASFFAKVEKLIVDFRRTAQTAVALRVLLKERRVPTKPVEYAIDETTLRETFQRIKSKQEKYRQKASAEVARMIGDMDQMINNTQLPEEARATAQHMKNLLEKNLDHLRAGKDIADMPFFVEDMELQPDSLDINVPLEPTEQALAAENDASQAEEKGHGLTFRVWKWLSTPKDVTWDDVNKTYK